MKKFNPKKPKVKMSAVTDSKGCYNFTDLPDGKYNIKVKECEGGGKKIVAIEDEAKVHNDVNFECKKKR